MSPSAHFLWTHLESASSLVAVSASGLIQVVVSLEDGGSAGLARGLQYMKKKRHHHAGGVHCSSAFVMAVVRWEAVQ